MWITQDLFIWQTGKPNPKRQYARGNTNYYNCCNETLDQYFQKSFFQLRVQIVEMHVKYHLNPTEKNQSYVKIVLENLIGHGMTHFNGKVPSLILESLRRSV